MDLRDVSVHYREARLSDHEALLALGDVYDGLDYLSHRLPLLMSQPHIYRCFVMELNGKVMGFYYFYFPGGRGDTVVSGGARIHQAYRGLGLLDRMRQFCVSQLLTIYPEAFKNYVYISFDGDVIRGILQKSPEKLTLILTRKVKTMFTSMAEIKKFIQTHRHQGINDPPYQPSLEEFKRELASKETQNFLFPHDYLIVFWEPHQLLPECLDHVHNNNHVVTTKSVEFEGSAGNRSRVSTDPIGRPSQPGLNAAWSALSCFTITPCEAGLRLDLDFYGRDQQLLHDHVYKCLEYVTVKCPDYSGDLHLVVHHPEDTMLTSDAVFENYIPWRPGLWEHHSQYLLVRAYLDYVGNASPASSFKLKL